MIKRDQGHDKNPVTAQKKQRGHSLTLSQYVERRNGVPLGHPDSLRNMLKRSFGAASFARLWQYWNLIWGYGLGKYVHTPLQRVMPAAIALILTFVVSGGLHDLVTMALRRSVTFLFTPWFFVLGVGVVIGRAFRMNLSTWPRAFRVGINVAYLLIGLIIALFAKRVLAIP